jgi:hypothetical protein
MTSQELLRDLRSQAQAALKSGDENAIQKMASVAGTAIKDYLFTGGAQLGEAERKRLGTLLAVCEYDVQHKELDDTALWLVDVLKESEKPRQPEIQPEM